MAEDEDVLAQVCSKLQLVTSVSNIREALLDMGGTGKQLKVKEIKEALKIFQSLGCNVPSLTGKLKADLVAILSSVAHQQVGKRIAHSSTSSTSITELQRKKQKKQNQYSQKQQQQYAAQDALLGFAKQLRDQANTFPGRGHLLHPPQPFGLVPPSQNIPFNYGFPQLPHPAVPSPQTLPVAPLNDYEKLRNAPMINVLVQNDKDEPREDTESKIEPPSWADLEPVTALERQEATSLSKLGFSLQKSLEVLRQSNGDTREAQERLMINLRDLQEAKMLDDVALQSEDTALADKERARKDEDMRLQYSDVLQDGAFRTSLFLDPKVGLSEMSQALSLEQDGVFDLSKSEFRESCVQLLVLESRALIWYGLTVNSYMYGVIQRLKASFTVEDVEREVGNLKNVLFEMPKRSGDVPQTFMDALSEYPLQMIHANCSTAALARADPGKLLNAQDTSVSVVSDPVRATEPLHDVIDLVDP